MTLGGRPAKLGANEIDWSICFQEELLSNGFYFFSEEYAGALTDAWILTV